MKATEKFPEVGAFDHLEWTYDGAFEQLFGLGRGEFEQKFSKNSNARGLPGGDVEASIWLVDYRKGIIKSKMHKKGGSM